MRTSFRTTVVGLGVAVAVGLSALPASAGLPPILKVARHKEGPYKDQLNLNVGSGQKKEFFIKVRNASDQADPVPATLRQVNKVLYKTKYFKGDEVIPVATSEGYDLTLTDKARRFRGIVKDIESAPEPDCFVLELDDGDIAQALVGINGGLCG